MQVFGGVDFVVVYQYVGVGLCYYQFVVDDVGDVDFIVDLFGFGQYLVGEFYFVVV